MLTIHIDKNNKITFGEAMVLLNMGHTISRFTLNYPCYYKLEPYRTGDGIVLPNMVTVYSKNHEDEKSVVDYPFNIQDVMAEDWIVYTPNQKL